MKIVDLNESLVVLGGGLNALVVAIELLKAGKRVTMIEAGRSDCKAASSSEYRAFKKNFSSPKFGLKDRSFTYAGYINRTKVKAVNFKVIGSLATGGLSNLWGGDIRDYDDDDLKDFPYSKSEVASIEEDILNLMTNYNPDGEKVVAKEVVYNFHRAGIDGRCAELIEQWGNSSENIGFDLPKLAILVNDKDDRKRCDHSDACLVKCPNGSIFNAAYEIEKLRENPNFVHLTGVLIEDVSKSRMGYTLSARNMIDGKEVKFSVKTIFCSLGPLSTSKLVVNFTKSVGHKLPLLSTPAASFLIFAPFKKRTNSLGSGLSTVNANFRLKVRGYSVTGGLFPFPNDILPRKFRDQKITKYLYLLLDWLFFSRILIATINFPSTLSSNWLIVNSKNELLVKGEPHKSSLRCVFKDTLKLLGVFFRRRGYMIMPFYRKLLEPGEDIHLGGTLPMMAEENQFGSSVRGELFGYKDFYVTDASSLPFLAAKGCSFASMVNSAYIARQYIRSSSN